MKQSKQNNDAACELERLRIWSENERRHREILKERLEEAAEILSALTRMFSKTRAITTWSKDMRPQEYDEVYWEATNKLGRLEAIIDVHFDSLRSQCDKFSGSTNIFWGMQNTLLHHSQENAVADCQHQLGDVWSAADGVAAASRELRNGINHEGIALNQQLLATR
jgi:hypothetical protein